MKKTIKYTVLTLAGCIFGFGVATLFKAADKYNKSEPSTECKAQEVVNEPELVVCFPWADDNIKKGYPVHWGPEPQIQTKDYRKLPEPFGMGSSTLHNWIKKNQEQDAKRKQTKSSEVTFEHLDKIANYVVPPVHLQLMQFKHPLPNNK